MRRILLIYFLVSVWSFLLAQSPHYIQIDLQYELNINDFSQDSLGVIWICADEGVYAYNGFELKEIESFDTLGFKGQSSIVHGELVIVGCSKGSLRIYNSFDEELKAQYIVEEGIPITGMLASDSSELYVATYGSGLYKLNIKSSDLIALPSQDECRFINGISQTQDGKVILATDKGLQVVSKDEVSAFRSDLSDILITEIAGGKNGTLWIVDTHQNILSVDEWGEIRTHPIPGSPRILELFQTSTEILASTSEGIYWLPVKNNYHRWTKISDGLGRIGSMFIDDEYNLWVGSNKHELWKASLYFKSVKWQKEVEIQAIQIANDLAMIGTSNGLFLSDIGEWDMRVKFEGLNITCLERFNDYILVGTYNNGILILDQRGNQIDAVTKADGLADNSILALEVSNFGDIQASTLAGVYALSLEKLPLEVIQPYADLNEHYVIDILCDNKGTWWYGTDRSGISYSAGEEIVRVTTDSSGNELGSVYSITQATNGQIWISTQNLGLMYWNGNEMQKWISPHGTDFQYTSVVALEENELLLISESNIELYNLGQGELVSFDEEIGLEPLQGFLNNYSETEAGTWFAHDERIWVYNNIPKVIRTYANTSLDRIEVNLNPVEFDIQEFRESENNLTFYYSGILHRNADRLFYGYFLEGFDTEWRVTKDRQVSYPRLSPGTYTFNVKATHDEYGQFLNPETYTFTIRRAFYKTNIFLAIVTIILVVLIYLVIRRRRIQIELKNELERKRIETQLISLKSQLNPHFMFNSFNTMIGLVEEDPPRGIQFIELMTDFYRGVLEIGESELIPLYQEIELLKLYIALLKERHGKALQVSIQDFSVDGMIPPLSLQMLVENGVKHNIVSEREPLMMIIYKEEEFIVVENELNPRPDKKESFGIGLKNIQSRYKLLKGLEVIIEQSGEKFKVKLPVINANSVESD